MAEKLFRWWPVILAVVSIAVAWGALGTKVAANCDQINELNADVSEMDRLIPSIQTDLEWIKQTLLEIKAEL